ncbi:hypothetical protein [Prosthecochloris sp. HL-130-GSB]|jgi:ribosome maturation factor RimP|uniref:Ribosome maturation factor RimP n=1 Tax=Prosthecochloris aestuarii TaxID=1102 RepID=A0A831WVU5_PROAE|nr:hypothetical protein [Prosthecochloris sp. HL-130-GSB]ARM30279.1 hypothetical protein B9H02_01715 [Prosthecochloris sp. HL-130-GSB]MBO8091888.1 ribosome maturation factor RimP [Prosthecochloris sp.]HED31509.1 ribosome maturation factor RimP [Prosthecochloris aestuarii]
MIDPQLAEAIERCISQYSAREDLDRQHELFLVDMSFKGGSGRKVIEILVETEQGVTISQCAALSRLIRDEIEESDELPGIVGESFELTVSSPGVGGPIRHPRQYVRQAGRVLRVHYRTDDNEIHEVTGRLLQADVQTAGAASIVIQPEGRGRRNKGGALAAPLEIPLDTIEKAVVQVEF